MQTTSTQRLQKVDHRHHRQTQQPKPGVTRKHNVPIKLLREHVPAVLPDGVPGGPGRPAQGLYVLPQWVLQVRGLRHKTDAENVLQQPAPTGRQGGVLFEPRTQDRPGSSGRHVGGHPQRPKRAEVDDVRQRPDPRQRQGHVRRRGAQHQTASERADAEPLAVTAAEPVHRRVVAGLRLPVRQIRRLGAAHSPRSPGHRTAQVVRQQKWCPREAHSLLSGEHFDR